MSSWPADELTVRKKIGIGTDTPTENLDVKGNIKLNSGVAVGEFSSDVTLATASHQSVPTTQTVKTYVDNQVATVSTTLATKADQGGSNTQDFQANNLKVQGNLEVTGTTTFRNIEQHQGDVELGNEDTDRTIIRGVLESSHPSGALQINSPVSIKDKIIIDDSGNVGIGTTAPSFGLDVRGESRWICSADSSQTIGGWRLGRWPDYQANQWVYLSRTDRTAYQDLAVGALWAGGALRFGTADDVAEMTPTKETDQLESGDVVIIDHPPDNRVLLAKSEKPYDSRVAGVISDPDTAGLMIGGSHPQDRDRADIKPLALCGRVLTKVSIENGDIHPGDCLTTASTSGHAMKATEPGYILGKAMQSFNGTVTGQSVGKIWVLVNLGWVGHHY